MSTSYQIFDPFFKKYEAHSNYRPHLISIELDPIPSKDDENRDKSEVTLKNISLEKVENLVKIIKDIEGYNPIIKLFNCPEFTTEQQERIDYPHIMHSSGETSFDLLMNMLNIFKSKKGEDDPYENDPLIDKDEHPFLVYP